MSPLLRRIRRQLLEGGRFGRYLLYAAGEILLIVIGVLLALQLNNWNESRQRAKIEDQLLEGFLRDLAQDTVSLNRGIEGTGWMIERRRRLLERTEYEDVSFDSLTELATRTWTVGSINLRSSTFVKLQSYRSGYPITERVVLDRILDYYTTEFDKHQGLLKWDEEAGAEESQILWYREDFETVPLGRALGQEHVFPRLKSDAESARALRTFLQTETARDAYRLDYLRKFALHQYFREKKERVLELMDIIRDYRAGEE